MHRKDAPRRLPLLLLTLVLLPAVAAVPAESAVLVKMGTVAPEGSVWHRIFQEMGAAWKDSDVELRIYPGGVLGDEPDLVRKMRIGQIHAAALTSTGLADIDAGVNALGVPMMFRSYEELDYVRERIRRKLEKRLEARGFVVLNWGDAGWVMFFAKQPFAHPDDVRKMKLFAWAGDNDAIELWKVAGFQPISLAATDILPGLQTGLINAFDTTPLLALSSQWFGLAPHMLDLKWAPLVGATVIRKGTWEKIPASRRQAVLNAAREAGDRLKGEVRTLNRQAIGAMQQHGLTVHRASDEVEAAWRETAEALYPRIRGGVVPADMFDEVLRLRDEFRAADSGAPAAGGR